MNIYCILSCDIFLSGNFQRNLLTSSSQQISIIWGREDSNIRAGWTKPQFVWNLNFSSSLPFITCSLFDFYWSWNSTVCTVILWQAGWSGIAIPGRARHFSFLRSTLPHGHWVPVTSFTQVKLATCHLVLRLIMLGAVRLLPPYAVMACRGATWAFVFLFLLLLCPLPFSKSNTFDVYCFLAQLFVLAYPVDLPNTLSPFQSTLQNDP